MSGALDLRHARDLRPGDIIMWNGYAADILDLPLIEIVIEPNGPARLFNPMCAVAVIGRMPC